MSGHEALEEMRANPGVLYYSSTLGPDTVAAFNGAEYVFIGDRTKYVTQLAQFSTAMLLAEDWDLYGSEAPKPLCVRIRAEAFVAANDPMRGPEYACGMLRAASMAEECGQ